MWTRWGSGAKIGGSGAKIGASEVKTGALVVFFVKKSDFHDSVSRQMKTVSFGLPLKKCFLTNMTCGGYFEDLHYS